MRVEYSASSVHLKTHHDIAASRLHKKILMSVISGNSYPLYFCLEWRQVFSTAYPKNSSINRIHQTLPAVAILVMSGTVVRIFQTISHFFPHLFNLDGLSVMSFISKSTLDDTGVFLSLSLLLLQLQTLPNLCD